MISVLFQSITINGLSKMPQKYCWSKSADFEIIIVNDGSTTVLRTYPKNNSATQYQEYPLLQTKASGCRSSQESRSQTCFREILVFIDSDMTVDKNYLSELVSPILEGKTKGTFSKNEFVSN